MNLRRVEAESYSEALKKVRSVYGEDALIVGTRTMQRGGVLGLGGKQVVEVYVSDAKQRAQRLREARASMNPHPPVRQPQHHQQPQPQHHQQPQPEQPRGHNGFHGPPPQPVAPPDGAYAFPQVPDRSPVQRNVGGPYPQPAHGPAAHGPVPGPASPPAPGGFEDNQIPQAARADFFRARQTLTDQLRQGSVPAATAPAPPPAESKRILEIGQTLDILREEVRQLLRRSEGPPWGHPALEQAYAFLRERDVEDDLARQLVSRLDRHVLPEKAVGEGALRGLLSAHLARYMSELQGEAPATQARLQVFVGPTGVGKTTTIAKLAARERYTLGKKVALVTMDTFRIAAVDQLRKYADIIGLELKVVSDPPGLREAVASLEGCDTIFVDSAGRSPSDEMRLGELESFVRSAPDPFVNLVLSVTAGPRTLAQSIERFKRVGFQNIILTKLDETPCPGVILSALAAAQCPVSFVTNGQHVPDDIEPVDTQRLADLVLRGGGPNGSGG